MDNIREVSPASLRERNQSSPAVCDMFGVAADEGRVIVDSGTKERVGSREALQSAHFIDTESPCQTPRCGSWTCDVVQTGQRYNDKRVLFGLDADASWLVQHMCH